MESHKLIIANCRGSKPVIRELKKCTTKIDDLLIEINQCKGKNKLVMVRDILFKILEDNK